MSYRRIMVTLDGSDFAAQALPHAQAIAQQFGAQLVLYQVVPDGDELVAQEPVSPENIEAMEAHVDPTLNARHHRHLMDTAMESLREMVDDLALHRVKAIAEIGVGMPAEQIIDYAEQNDVDLVVMSTHGRSGLARWVYGSVADKVLRGAQCPVLLVRAALP